MFTEFFKMTQYPFGAYDEKRKVIGIENNVQ